MQTHQDLWFSVNNQLEHAYFVVSVDNPEINPYLEFIPWPIKVSELIFSDGTSFTTAAGGGAAQTPWQSNIDGGGFNLFNVGNVDASSFSINGVPFTGSQTPWTSNIDAAGFILANCPQIVNGSATVQLRSDGNAYLSSASAYLQVSIDSNIYHYAAQSQFFNVIGDPTTRVGINTVPAFALDVAGDVNTSGCYRMLAAPFACPDGTGGINLSNIALINGSPVGVGSPVIIKGSVPTQADLPASGNNEGDSYFVTTPAPPALWVWDSTQWIDTGAVTIVSDQTPWLSNIDAAGFNLTNAAVVYTAWVAGTGSGPLTLVSNGGAPQVVISGNTTTFDMSVGILNQNPQYPLDVNGNVNSSGCYLIAGTTFACSNGSGGVNLSNVALINGAAPASQTPWLSTIDAAGFSLSNIPSIANNGNLSITSDQQLIITGLTYAEIIGQTTRIATGTFYLTNQSSGNDMLAFNTTIQVLTIGSLSPSLPITVSIYGALGLNTPSPQFPLDVSGDVNTSGCYLIGGTTFSCLSSGTVTLSNIGLMYVVTSSGAIEGNINAGGVFGYAGIQLNSNDAMNLFVNTFISMQVGGTQIFQANGTLANFLIPLTVDGAVNTNGSPYQILGTSFAVRDPSGAGVYLENLTYINGTGSKLGIQNSSPQYPLDVGGDVNTSGCYLIDGATFACSDGSGGVNLSNVALINGAPPGGGGAPAPPAQSVQWNNSGAFGGSALFVFDDANTTVGIGTSSVGSADGISPYTLDVVGVTDSYVGRFTNPGLFTGLVIDHGDNSGGGDSILSFRSAGRETAIIQYDDDEDSLTFWTGQQDAAMTALCCATNSYVGVLNTSPQYPLDVTGHVNASGCYFVDGRMFACSTGPGQPIDLSNINTINGVVPGGFWQAATSPAGAIYYDGGNVGIGTSSPGAPLECNGIIRSTNSTGAPTSGVGVEVQYSPGLLSGVIQTYDRTGDAWKALYIQGSPIALMQGNVGIGTSDPVTPLEVHIGTNVNIGIGPQYQVSGAARIAAFSDDGSAATPMELGASLYSFLGGNVGIGTASPTMPLEVVGTATAPAPSYYSINLVVRNQQNVTNSIAGVALCCSPFHDMTVSSYKAPTIVSLLRDPSTGRADIYINPYFSGNFNATGLIVAAAGPNLAFVGIGTTPAHSLELGQDDAAKPNTNTWTVTSDARTKQNVRPLEGGLSIINQIVPIEAEYNGLCDTPQGTRVVSVVVEDLQKILPGCCPSYRGKLRDEDAEETEILGFNSHEILFHLILAVQQLAQKIS